MEEQDPTGSKQLSPQCGGTCPGGNDIQMELALRDRMSESLV